MSFGIKKSNCKFYVDKDARTAVCVIQGTRDYLIDFLEDISFKDVDFWVNYDLTERLKMPNSFMGKAVCSKDDEWNEEYGCNLAFMRAKDKFYRSFFKRAQLAVSTISRNLDSLCETFNDIGEKVGARMSELHSEFEEQE